MADTKGRILFLERYMLEHTDDEHSITTDDLISIYEENGYKAHIGVRYCENLEQRKAPYHPMVIHWIFIMHP